MSKLVGRRDSGTKLGTIGIFACLVLVNVTAWGWTWISLANRPDLFGTALLAYVLGLRHAFDPDHIAAIDNVVRKLMQEGRPARLTGCYFALGHSSIVVAASLFIACTALSFDLRELSSLNLIRSVASSTFLIAIGVANIVVLKSTWRTFARVRFYGGSAEHSMDDLQSESAVTRLFRPVFRLVSRSWHMFPVGIAFGIGFDTATEIGLFGISATQAGQGVSLWTILLFPLLFAAGMTLMDAADSVLMTNAYGWAFINPVRKLWYNLTLTIASAAVAILIGGLEVLGLLCDRLNLDTGPWIVIRELNENLDRLGFWIVGIFIASWVCSAVLYRVCGYDELAISHS